jgi:hypothetical protein
LPAIALSRYRFADDRGTVLRQHRGSGKVLLFTAAILLAGSGILLLFYPFLTLTAQTGYTFIAQTGSQMAAFLGRIIMIVNEFGSRIRIGIPAASDSEGGAELVKQFAPVNGSSSLVEQVFLWGIIMALLLLMLAVAVWVFWRLIRWLLSGGAKIERKRHEGFSIKLMLFLQRCLNKFRQAGIRIKRYLFRSFRSGQNKPATCYFRRMLDWGSRSGLSRINTETPGEYGLALKRCFPEIQAEIEMIVNSFNNEVYGEAVPDGGETRKLNRAWRRLCSPKHWPVRLRSRIMTGGRMIIDGRE